MLLFFDDKKLKQDVARNINQELLQECFYNLNEIYRHTSSISITLVSNKSVNNSDDGALPVDAAPTRSSFST